MTKTKMLVDRAAAKVVKAEEKLAKAEERLRKAADKVEARKSKLAQVREAHQAALAQQAARETPEASPTGEDSVVQDTTRE